MHEDHQIACESHIAGMIPHKRISYQPQLGIVPTVIFPPLGDPLNLILLLYSLPLKLNNHNNQTKEGKNI